VFKQTIGHRDVISTENVTDTEFATLHVSQKSALKVYN
jgi:hypothetical protein